jgi:predicted MFS family arabinose efflux permease
VPETADPAAHGKFDVTGAVLAALALAGITYSLIEASAQGASVAIPAGLAGAAAGVAFVLVERHRGRDDGRVPPMLPLDVFASRQFTAVNLVTFVVYAALGAVFFLLVLELQVVSRYSPLAAGLSLLPSTVLMLLLSSRAGQLAQRIGPRWLMTAGPLISAAGLLLATRIGPHASYVADVLPAVALFGLGLSATVAPLTATVLASADVTHAGVASGVNNAVARAAGLLAVAGLPLAVGLSQAGYHQRGVLHGSFQQAMVICAVLLVLGAILSALTIDNDVLRPSGGRTVPRPECHSSCPVGAPPLEPAGPRVTRRLTGR